MPNYVCTINIKKTMSVSGKNYDEAMINMYNELVKEIGIRPDKFIENNKNNIVCHILPNE